jgi:hypothetical protein
MRNTVPAVIVRIATNHHPQPICPASLRYAESTSFLGIIYEFTYTALWIMQITTVA